METIQIFCPAIDLYSGTSSSCMLSIVQGNFMPLKLHLFIESIGFYWKIFSWLHDVGLFVFRKKCVLVVYVYMFLITLGEVIVYDFLFIFFQILLDLQFMDLNHLICAMIIQNRWMVNGTYCLGSWYAFFLDVSLSCFVVRCNHLPVIRLWLFPPFFQHYERL